MRNVVTEDELAELIPLKQEAIYDSRQEHPPVEERNRLLEQAVRFWEQSARDLQKEVRELRDRIDRLERQQRNDKSRNIPVISEPVSEPEPEQAPSEDRLSRMDRLKSRRSRWF